MANFHCQIRPIQRSKRRSVIQLVSYVTGLKLRSLRTGRRYRRRIPGDVMRYACVGSNLPMQVLWQKAESAERRKNSIEGRHQIVALPRENSQEEQWKMLLAMAKEINRLLGVPVVVALHDNAGEPDKPRNPHGHLIFATRVWNERAQLFVEKTRALDVATTGSVLIESIRKTWEDIVNAGLPAGVPKVSRLSHARAGRDRISRRHLGERATELERKGIRTRYGDFNRKVDKLDRIAAQSTNMERLRIPVSKVSHAERQRQLGLERQLAIAYASIGSMPSARLSSQVADKVPAIDAGMAAVVSAPAVFKESPDERPTKCRQIGAAEDSEEVANSSRKVVLENGNLAGELAPQPLEAELSLASAAIEATRPKDHLTPQRP